jgi:uncharacterized protein (DUF1015 family)
MNNAAILPYIGMHALQIQNVKRDVVKKASITELNKEIVDPINDTNNTLLSENMNDVGTNINDLTDLVSENDMNNIDN